MQKRLVSTLLLNVFVAAGLCATAQGLLLARGLLPAFDLGRFVLNFCVAYPAACLIGWLIPLSKAGLAVCRALKLKPGTLHFAIGMKLCINLVVTVLMSAVMTVLNVVILAGQGLAAFLDGYAGNFLPMYAASCIVSCLAEPLVRHVLEREPPETANGSKRR